MWGLGLGVKTIQNLLPKQRHEVGIIFTNADQVIKRLQKSPLCCLTAFGLQVDNITCITSLVRRIQYDPKRSHLLSP